MITIRQIERHWNGKDYGRLYRELVAHRPEAMLTLETEARAPLAAAMGVIRLDEYAQSHVPLAGRLVRAILVVQESDGGWGDPMTTALCLRALLCGNGNGLAVERGIGYLANLQKDEGIWPSLPLRRLPADPHVSAFILCELGDNASFRQTVRMDAALAWFEAHAIGLDEPTLALWDRARLRSRVRTPRVNALVPLWSNVG